MKFIRAALAAVLGLALGGAGFVATSVKADAHTPEVSATCKVLDVNLANYQTDPGHPETFKTVHHDAVGSPTTIIVKAAVVEVSHVETQADQRFSWTGGPEGPGTVTPPDADWQGNTHQYNGTDPLNTAFQDGQGNASWFFWTTKDVKVVDIKGSPASTQEIPNPAYVAAFDEKVSNNDAVAPKVNHVTVLVNEVSVESVDFGASYVKSFPVTAGDTYKVIVRAWDDPDGSKGWSKNFRGTIVACPVENKVCSTIANGPVSTNLNDLWGNVDTRSAGHVEYVTGGLHVWTDDATSNAKVSEGIAANFPLKNTGALSLAWTGSTPPPGINLFVNFGADGNGTLVYEAVYGQDLWLTNGSSAAVKAKAPVNGGGNGSQWHGTITQWLSVYPDAQVVGVAYSLGSGVKGDGVISSITAGCTKYTFDYQQSPKPGDKVWTGEWTNGEWGCGDTSVEQTRKVVTTPYVLKDREWVLDSEHAVTTYEHRTVALTEDQKKWFQNTDSEAACYVAPKEKATLIEVSTAQWACNDKTAVTSTVTTSYSFLFDKATGTYGDAIASVGTPVAGVRDLTASEFVACAVPTVVTLPPLGADVNPWGIAGGALALLSGLGLVFGRKRG